MKLTKTALGKKLVISSQEWHSIGKKAGWLKQAEPGRGEERTYTSYPYPEKNASPPNPYDLYMVDADQRPRAIVATKAMNKILQDLRAMVASKGPSGRGIGWKRTDLVPFGKRIVNWANQYTDCGAGDTEPRNAVITAAEEILGIDRNTASDENEAYHLWNADFYMTGAGANKFGYGRRSGRPNRAPTEESGGDIANYEVDRQSGF